MQSKGNDDRMFCDRKSRSENQVKEVGRGGHKSKTPRWTGTCCYFPKAYLLKPFLSFPHYVSPAPFPGNG